MKQDSLFAARPTATFSACTVHAPSARCPDECTGRLYRYTLEWPAHEAGTGTVLFVLANPSTATHLIADPTVGRCITYATDWRYARCAVANARAYRSTDPDGVPPDPIGIGPDNDRVILSEAARAALVVCGWGKLGGVRGPVVLDLIRQAGKVPHALKLNKDGSPQHPLYLRRAAKPVPL